MAWEREALGMASNLHLGVVPNWSIGCVKTCAHMVCNFWVGAELGQSCNRFPMCGLFQLLKHVEIQRAQCLGGAAQDPQAAAAQAIAAVTVCLRVRVLVSSMHMQAAEHHTPQ